MTSSFPCTDCWCSGNVLWFQGFTIDTSSNLALATSLRECAAKSEGDEEFVRLLMAMTTMAMSEASYISSGSRPVNEFTHYGLALEYYTHFTVGDATELDSSP
jgi:DIS3-like exonuclease 1